MNPLATTKAVKFHLLFSYLSLDGLHQLLTLCFADATGGQLLLVLGQLELDPILGEEGLRGREKVEVVEVICVLWFCRILERGITN